MLNRLNKHKKLSDEGSYYSVERAGPPGIWTLRYNGHFVRTFRDADILMHLYGGESVYYDWRTAIRRFAVPAIEAWIEDEEKKPRVLNPYDLEEPEQLGDGEPCPGT